ncbi:T9SS type A sorting domain-containing protein [Kordia jejudonensis]|uniref:T9SS type A sorting domain-containing protein n=1 Tax=Kordia jejudonensis TaxID=1348245 RepID=UPI00069A309D|nr:T9SS type A sorting domain-containing protein [Kordia jejudonensis]
MTKKILAFVMLISASLFLNAQCGPSFSDNSNFDAAGNSTGISFTTDGTCSGILTSITFNSGFSVIAASPDNMIGQAIVRLYEGDGLGGTVLGTLNIADIGASTTFDFSALMISMNTSSQYTIIVSDFTLPTLTGRGFNGPFSTNYTGGVRYRNGVAQIGEHLAFSVNIDDSTLSVTDVDTAEMKLRVYPNPATNSIQLTALQKTENYTILDISGKKVVEGIVNENEPIYIKQLTKGIYFIQLEKRVLKFIKK